MALSVQSIRRREKVEKVNYKKLHEGDFLPKIFLKKSRVVTASVLPETYTVERIICQKQTPEGKLFLVKWTGFHCQESTWEPESHLSDELVNSFLCPPVASSRLQSAAETFERAVQQRLSSKPTTVSVKFSLDIFRHVFSTNESVLVFSEDELKKLPLCTNWSYKVNRKGAGCRVSFPLRDAPRFYMRPVYLRKGSEFVKMLIDYLLCSYI